MLLTRRLVDPPIVWVQGPLALRGWRSQLQPDVVLLRPKADFYRSGHPEPEDVLLVIEVMDTSVQRDQRIKRPLYAQAEVRELWLVDVNADTIEVCREPAAGAYANVAVLARGSTVTPLAFPDLTLRTNEILG
jgi:Uma2 family endonuclease